MHRVLLLYPVDLASLGKGLYNYLAKQGLSLRPEVDEPMHIYVQHTATVNSPDGET